MLIGNIYRCDANWFWFRLKSTRFPGLVMKRKCPTNRLGHNIMVRRGRWVEVQDFVWKRYGFSDDWRYDPDRTGRQQVCQEVWRFMRDLIEQNHPLKPQCQSVIQEWNQYLVSRSVDLRGLADEVT